MTKAFNENPLISIIVPIYKTEKYLHKCINSIIHQTYQNLEIILVDDGSPDQCGIICDEYAKKDSRIQVIHQKNGGLSAARNAGISLAKGSYIGFIDSDDWIELTMFEKLYDMLIKYQADISVCGIKKVGSEDEKIVFHPASIIQYNQEEYIKKYMKIKSQTCEYYAVNKLYKKELLVSDQYPVGLTSEDVLGTLKAVLNAKKIVSTDQEFYYYRQINTSITGSFSEKDFDLIKIWDEVVLLLQKYPHYLSYGILNRKRINLTLLYRMALNIEVKKLKNMEIVNNLLSEIKKDKKDLLNSDISVSRKIFLILFCHNYYFTARCLKIMKGRKK